MEPLPLSDLLTTLGEIGAAFIGFSMIAGVLRPESSPEMRQNFRFRHVAEAGLGVLFVSFLPLLIHAYGANTDTTWIVASSICLIPATVVPIVSWREVGVLASLEAEPVRTVVSLALNVLMVSLFLSNVALPAPYSGARYATVVVLLLVTAGLIFIGATFGTSKEPPAV